MKKLLMLLFLTVLMVAVVGCNANTPPVEQETQTEAPAAEDVIVAEVADKTIDLATFQKAFYLLEKSYVAQYGEGVMDRQVNGKTLRDIIKGELLSSLVNEVILESKLSADGFAVEQSELDNALQQYSAAIKLDSDEVKAEMAELGIDDDFIKERIRMQMHLAELQRQVRTDIEEQLSNDSTEFDKEIVKVDAQHILVATEAEAKAVIERLEAGESFETLAQELSQDPGSGANGGNLGYFTRGQMVPAFEQMAFGLNEGEVSSPVQTQFGFHIIRTNDSVSVAELKGGEQTDENVSELASFQQQYVDSKISEQFYEQLEALRTASEFTEYLDRVVIPVPETEAPASETSEAETTN